MTLTTTRDRELGERLLEALTAEVLPRARPQPRPSHARGRFPRRHQTQLGRRRRARGEATAERAEPPARCTRTAL